MKSLSPQSLELQDALNLLLQVGEALVYAHDLHIFHGSLKPENILFDANGQVVVTDFNLLSHHDLLIHDYITDEYPLCYMAPEQFFGTCDAKSDQHALGCLAYELITGRTPFVAQSSDLMHKQHSSPQPVPFFEGDAHLPPSLKAAILKTLDKDPNERFADLSLFLEIIRSTSSPLLTSAAPRFTNFHMSGRQNTSFIPQVVASEQPRHTPPTKSAPSDTSEWQMTSFMPKVIASERPRYTPLTKGTLGSIAEWQNASFIPKATTSDSTTPTPLMKSNLDKRSEWQMTSFTPQVVVSDPVTPMPFVESHTSAIPFPFSQRSRERLSSQLSRASSKVRRGEGEVHALVQGETEPNLTSEQGPSPHDASYQHRTHYHSSIFLRSAIGLAVLLLVILGLVAYSLWLLRS
jgi:serine/threonine protein kinase